MGSVYQALAKRDPSGARTYLESAVDAYEKASILSASGTAAERAEDLEALGTSMMQLAHLSGTPGCAER